MAWDDDLTEEQKAAARHTGVPARLLAGPGTGKTRVLTRRIQFLIEDRRLGPEGILALTFTRAATHELRQRLLAAMPESPQPRVSTLHSFALRQLLRNACRLTTLPQPLRIADDWEERNIILEDTKAILGLRRIGAAQDLFNQLSADWESLAADQGARSPNPRFIGTWQEHRRIYGYTLRSELVYQLKRALEQMPDFQLEVPTTHLLIDEYQDLNRCDLEVTRALIRRGAELYVAGDDDQSIYGFRKAHPDGIRNFDTEYPGASDLRLGECKRCDTEILEIGEFIANLDPRRLQKRVVPEPGRPPGEVALLQFNDNKEEVRGIADIVKSLVEDDGVPPHEILILVRTDTRGAFSAPLREALGGADIPCSQAPTGQGPLDSGEGRQVLAVLRLLSNPNDHLSWRTLLQLRRNDVGEKGLAALYDLARERGLTFSAAIASVEVQPDQLSRFGSPITKAAAEIRRILDSLAPLMQLEVTPETMRALIRRATTATLGHEDDSILAACVNLAGETQATSIQAFLSSLEARNVAIEPEIQQGSVNILTMHKAKGLTATAVIILAVEDEHLPGRQRFEPELGDERRLLYVSLTRARKTLLLTYCSRRYGQQQRLGLNPGRSARTLSQFLRNAPLRPQPGALYAANRRPGRPEAA